MFVLKLVLKQKYYCDWLACLEYFLVYGEEERELCLNVKINVTLDFIVDGVDSSKKF